MQQAFLREACATPDREEAPERQLGGPQNFSTYTPGHSAGRPSQQEANTNRDGYGRDGSRLIHNTGQLKKAIRRVHDLVWHRHKPHGPSAVDAAVYYAVVAAIENAIAARDPSFKRDLAGWTRRHLRRLTTTARVEIDAEMKGRAIEVTQRFLGEQLELTYAERDEIGFADALPFDMTDMQMEAKRKARDAQRKRAKREEAGATPRTRCRARQLEQNPGVPMSTFYYRNPATPRPAAR